ncbi:hypothetical protein [Rhodococcus globerulus]|uniref:Uncharacterized protein n=1 Tax=Rhodococcus globerulus TaxID=33008 RepID=A0ABU4BS92_RHOGO|nr:hypothetical protein [Rhodococcus globerulus]MDV6267064.1 hypothetical protein [Rhodococcus globerulus]
MTITVIIGPPCAGKSTYTREHATNDDVIVDFDRIATAFGATEPHEASPAVRAVAFSARATAIATILKGIDTDSWIIHTTPSASWIKQYEDADAEMVTLDPGIDECLRRAADDQRPEWTADAIRAWYDTNAQKSPQARLRCELALLGVTASDPTP